MLPECIQRLSRKNYLLWKQNPYHPSLQFKCVSNRKPVYSVRIGIGWRALGVKSDDVMVWFLIGPHSEYNELISKI
ncbi:hypothetical protein LLG95_17690 [bacterium]|nr:hypothetical protein [bacterium]